jgi:hypothetical protein
MYTSDSACELARIQFHRFDAGCPLDPLLQSVPHPAFKVDNLHRAIEGMTVLLGPYEPIDGLRVAVVADGGMPVELIETTLSDEQIWGRAKSGRNAPLYGAGVARDGRTIAREKLKAGARRMRFSVTVCDCLSSTQLRQTLQAPAPHPRL